MRRVTPAGSFGLRPFAKTARALLAPIGLSGASGRDGVVPFDVWRDGYVDFDHAAVDRAAGACRHDGMRREILAVSGQATERGP